ncbi:MAG: hypothetical protein ABI995_07045 [Acidobacteriota bacterium]
MRLRPGNRPFYRLFGRQSPRARVDCVLNVTLFGCMAGVIFPGILISQAAIPALRRRAAGHGLPSGGRYPALLDNAECTGS